MISPDEFRAATDQLAREFGLSVTSARRTDEHSESLPNGFAHDPHTWGAAVDYMPVPPPERRGDLIARASELGLYVMVRQGHVHAQPAKWPAGPVKEAPDPKWEGLHL